ncbi:PREDICTED: 3-hydroxyanthranilate 3,4-dioxygenase-like isoform X2 [Priapulus caudatus]|nr:PREDICTED: 3-hydroxyanthranilate 3,4-dioxygenase-like isoform X2 [Priapulus caudatus]XP_014668905.1 PREDICTED: 3-hydroxyanthranilate 3,4-dioxygenase-like isoform X2 [Priapulus caudatus]
MSTDAQISSVIKRSQANSDKCSDNGTTESKKAKMDEAVVYNVSSWIEENKKLFLPPVCNKLMHSKGQLKVMFVGGPNSRKDYHIEEGDELFYQVKGDMCLKIMEKGEPKDIIIKEGEIFLLPARIPHSPQRFENTVGLVIERMREDGKEDDCLRYYTDGNKEVLWEKWFFCWDLVIDLPPVIKEYQASEQYKTGKPVEGFVKDPKFPIDVTTAVQPPFQFGDWLTKNDASIQSSGNKWVYGKDMQTGVIVFGEGENSDESNAYESWMWQMEGTATITMDGKSVQLKKDDSILIPLNIRYKAERPKGAVTLLVYMDPTGKTC